MLYKNSKNFLATLQSVSFNKDNCLSYYAKSSWKKSKALIFFYRIKASSSTVFTINGNTFLIAQKNSENVHNFFNQIIRSKKILKNFSFDILIKGGGFTSQIKALNLAFSKIINSLNTKKTIFLLDSQKFYHKGTKKERKKFGFKKARKGFQYSKR